MGAFAEPCHKSGSIEQSESGTTFAVELKPGGVWSGLTAQEPELVEWGTKGALYCDLYHSHHTKPVRKRVRFARPA